MSKTRNIVQASRTAVERCEQEASERRRRVLQERAWAKARKIEDVEEQFEFTLSQIRLRNFNHEVGQAARRAVGL